MSAVDLHHQHLQRRWAQEQGLVEGRRQRLLVAAGRAADALRERWPMVQGVWLFGSALDASSFRRHSDLDLVVEGLPAAAQLEALGLVEAVVDQSLANVGQEGIAIDLARWEDLPSHWQERLRRQAMALT
ncbi:MAG: nucleotidyltransferase domain-containing protein [Cyanobium sp. ELA507]